MAELIREEHLNQGKPEETIRFSQEEVDLFYAGTDPDYPNTDWLKVVARDWAPSNNIICLFVAARQYKILYVLGVS